MKARSLLVGAASVAILSMSLYAAEKIKLEGVKCVMNPKGAAKADKSVDYKGGKVFFCCDNCPKAFTSKVKKDEQICRWDPYNAVIIAEAKGKLESIAGSILSSVAETDQHAS